MSNALNIEQPLVGVGVMVMRDGEVLLHKRKNAHGEGEHASPGGHLEHGEAFAACAQREVAEECGIEIANVRFHFLSNIDIWKPRHYVHIGLLADWRAGEPQVLEPEKCEGWDWYSLDALPEPLFYATLQQVHAFRDGVNYVDLPIR